MPRKRVVKPDERERSAFERDLRAVGENMPDQEVGIEGADVGEVVRHGEDAETRIARELAEPHADTERETAEELDL